MGRRISKAQHVIAYFMTADRDDAQHTLDMVEQVFRVRFIRGSEKQKLPKRKSAAAKQDQVA